MKTDAEKLQNEVRILIGSMILLSCLVFFFGIQVLNMFSLMREVEGTLEKMERENPKASAVQQTGSKAVLGVVSERQAL